MTIVGTVGRTAVVSEHTPAITLQRSVAVLHPRTDVCSSRYLMYLLRSRRAYFETEAHGVAQKGIYLKQLSDVRVNVPDIEKQQSIICILDKVQAVIRKRQIEIIKLDDLIKARFVEMFGDPIINPKGFPIKNIDEVSILNKGITYAPEDVADEGMVVLRSSNIKGYEFDLEDQVKITKRVSPDKYVQENDILMCNRNGSARLVGKVALIPKLRENMTFGTFMTVVRSDLYEYLFTFFQMNAFREQIKFQTAVAINQISLPLLASVKLPIPPRDQIEEFSLFKQRVDKSKIVVQRALDEAQLLFDSLMQKYFG